jgi:hypothetical protein
MQIFGNGSALGLHVPQLLTVTGTSVGNGADTTEDTLQTYTIPASTLKSTGDRIHVVAGGLFAASTDTKSARLRWGGNLITSLQGTTAAMTSWSIDFWIVKTGASTQSFVCNGSMVGASGFPNVHAGTQTVTDTSTIAVAITGQNSTAATLNTITCQYFSVEYVH